jgi:anionic cell wall polymer biosynthesis LytR-Cps2A-Psr (LCP) family protein
MPQSFSRSKGNLSGWIIIASIIVIIIVSIFAGNFFKKEEKIESSFKNGDTLTFFIAAYNDDNVIKGGFALIFQTKTNRCAIVSILPKTYVNFGNAGYFTLEEAINKKLNYKEISAGISRLIGNEINYYFFINKNNLIKLIDILGGIEVYTDGIKLPAINVNIPQGLILFDGDKALEYLSFLNSESVNAEYDQLKRIQNFMRGFLKLKPDFLEQFNKDIISNYIYKLLNTNMSLTEFQILYREIKNKKIKSNIDDYSKGMINIILYCDKKNIPGYDYIYLPKKSDQWFWKEVKDGIDAIGKEYNEKYFGSQVIEILNGTNTVGLASRAGEFLSGFGFDILNVDNAESNDFEHTVIIVYGDEQKAKRLSELIKCKTIIIKDENLENKRIDLTLILGKDFDGKVVR